jgi:glycosyltransferase involved in cell wall biosynthesis
MRALVFSHEYPPVGGGGGRVAQDLCQGLARRGHAVRILTAAYADLPREQIDGGVEVVRLSSGRKQPFRAGMLAMAGYVWAAFWAGLRAIRAWKPDVLHVHFAVPGGAAVWLLSKLTGVPYVLTAHLGDVPGGTPEKTGRWFRYIFPFTPPIWRGAARVVAVSQFTRALAEQHYPVPVQVIFNGVDLRALDPGEIRVGQPPRLVFAGRFMQQKDPLQVVRALGAVRDLPWVCSMLGDGPLHPAVQAEIQRLGLAERFDLPGWVDPKDVLGCFDASDILFMPSLSEGLPVVGVQAMAKGLALLVTRVGGWADLVEEGRNGFLVAPGDEAGFAAALRRLLADPGALLAFRQSSRALAAKFDLEKIVSAYEQVLEEVSRA